MKDFSRRDFLKGVATTAGGTAVLVGCAPKTVVSPESLSTETVKETFTEIMTSENYKGIKWNFEVEPEPINDSQITETFTADVIIVGSGMSGLCCAVSAQEKGSNVLVFSASSKPISRGGSNHAFGSKIQKAKGIDYDSSSSQHLIKEELLSATYKVDQRKWEKWINNSAESMDWQIDIMAAKGLKCGLEHGYYDPDGLHTSPPASHNFYNDEQPFGALFGAPLQAQAYADTFVERGGTITYNTIAQYLIRGGVANGKSGRVEAVVAKNADGKFVKYVANKAVVLATGDFSKNPDMMAKYCPDIWEFFKGIIDTKINYDTDLSFKGIMPGDGHKMGLWIGAAWQKIAPVAPMITGGVPGPIINATDNFWGINLALNGKRFHNEVVSFSPAAHALMRLPDHTAFSIWDTAIANWKPSYDTFGSLVDNENGIPPETPEARIADWEKNVTDKVYYKGNTLEELVSQIPDIDQKAALESIARYNKYAEQGFDEEYHVNPEVLFPIKTAPFYAAKAAMSEGIGGSPSFLTVCGGLRTNEDNQVCAEDDSPIDGLYNVGIMTGDFYANSYTFVLFGQNLGSTCLTLPYLLGRDLAAL